MSPCQTTRTHQTQPQLALAASGCILCRPVARSHRNVLKNGVSLHPLRESGDFRVVAVVDGSTGWDVGMVRAPRILGCQALRRPARIHPARMALRPAAVVPVPGVVGIARKHGAIESPQDRDLAKSASPERPTQAIEHR